MGAETLKKPSRVLDHNTRIIVTLLAVITVIAVGTVLKAAQAVFLPLVIAWLLSYILGPVLGFLRNRRVPMAMAIVFILMLVLGVCYLAGVFFYGRVRDFAGEYERYAEQLNHLISTSVTRFPLDYNPLEDINWVEKVGGFLVGVSGSLIGFMSNLVMVIIFLVFLLSGKPFFANKVRHAFPAGKGDHVNGILHGISVQIGRYLSTQMLISFITGALVWAVLTLLNVDFAVTWGALAFLLNFIPTLGSIVASIPPILLALVQFYPRYWPCVLAAVLLLSIQLVMGNVIAPKMMGEKLNLSPVVVLLSLVFWGWLWGVVGAILSVPIAAAVKIVCENIELLRPISVLMGSGKRLPPAPA